MKNFTVFVFSVFIFCSLQASDFIYQVQFERAVGLEQHFDNLEKDQIKAIETIFRDNFNPSGFTQINPFLLQTAQASISDFAKTKDDRIKRRIIMNELKITHSLRGWVHNVGNVYYVRLFFSEINPTFKNVATANFDCAVSDSFAKCVREFAEKFAQNPYIIKEGKRTKESFQQEAKREKVKSVYGFLNVFPSDIGWYKEIPTEILKNINSSGVFKDQNCEEWRIPTEDEISLLTSERILATAKMEGYMSNEKNTGWLRPVADCRKLGENAENAQNSSLLEADKPKVIYGFLKVFPQDLGKYKKKPTEIVDKINSSSEQGVYGCKNWRIPTENELALIASSGIIFTAEDYLSSDKKSNGLLRLVADMPGYETKVENNNDKKVPEPEKESDNVKESQPDNKPVETAEPKENEESGADSKLEQGSKTKPQDSAEKPSNGGCSADIL